MHQWVHLNEVSRHRHLIVVNQHREKEREQSRHPEARRWNKQWSIVVRSSSSSRKTDSSLKIFNSYYEQAQDRSRIVSRKCFEILSLIFQCLYTVVRRMMIMIRGVRVLLIWDNIAVMWNCESWIHVQQDVRHIWFVIVKFWEWQSHRRMRRKQQHLNKMRRFHWSWNKTRWKNFVRVKSVFRKMQSFVSTNRFIISRPRIVLNPIRCCVQIFVNIHQINTSIVVYLPSSHSHHFFLSNTLFI